VVIENKQQRMGCRREERDPKPTGTEKSVHKRSFKNICASVKLHGGIRQEIRRCGKDKKPLVASHYRTSPFLPIERWTPPFLARTDFEEENARK
jgi:hypothetical protein